jgi:hypothetical protein
LVFLPWKLASLISRGTFMGAGLVLATFFWGKSIALYATFRKLRLATPVLAFLIAVLFMLYPADTGNFTMRALGRNAGVFFYFVSVLLLVLAAQQSNPVFSIAMLLAEGTSAFIAEQGYPLILFTPALLLMIKECTKQKKIILAGLWYAVLSLAVLNFLLVNKPRQTKLFEQGLVADRFQYVKEVILSNLLAYKWVFWDSWQSAAINTLNNFEWRYALFTLAIYAVVGITVYLLIRFVGKRNAPEPYTLHYFGPVLLASLAIIGLSFSPYSITTFRYSHFRVFYYAVAGAALAIGLIFDFAIQRLLPRWRNIVNIVFWGVIISLISFNGLIQHAYYVSISQVQQNILVSIVEQAPSIKKNTVIVLLVNDKTEGTFSSLDAYVFNRALSWTYGYDVGRIYTNVCNNINKCAPQINFKNSILFRYTEDGKTILLDTLPAEYQQVNLKKGIYTPYQQIDHYAPFPERVKGMFDAKPSLANVTPKHWINTGQTLNDRRACNVSYSGNCSLLFYNDGLSTGFTQQVAVTGDANAHFELSLWAKSDKAVPNTLSMATLTVFYKDGAQDEYSITGQLYKKWTMQNIKFETTKPYDHLLLKLSPDSDSASVWLDNILLLKDGTAIAIENPSFEKQ